MMQFTSPSLPSARARFRPASVRPSGAIAPAWRKSRRVRPSQNVAGRSASNRIMTHPPEISAESDGAADPVLLTYLADFPPPFNEKGWQDARPAPHLDGNFVFDPTTAAD